MAPEGQTKQSRWRLGRHGGAAAEKAGEKPGPTKWSMGMLNDPETIEVPGEQLAAL
jgi:hypothetical protein